MTTENISPGNFATLNPDEPTIVRPTDKVRPRMWSKPTPSERMCQAQAFRIHTLFFHLNFIPLPVLNVFVKK